MLFDVENSLSLPEIHHIVSKRDEVVNRFGPLFRDPSSLTQRDYLDFLSFEQEIGTLRRAIAALVDESEPLARRLDTALATLHGVGPGTLTPILLLAFPDKYGVWNGTSEPEMRERGVWPTFPRSASPGIKYEITNSVLLGLAADLGVDLWTLDALWWQSKLERQDNGHIKNAKFKAVWAMASQAENTAKQSYGQTVERTVKNKDLRLSKEALIAHLSELLSETGDRCAITGLILDYEGSDDQLRPSLDRIDSNGHYEVGNLQVVARFINFWKRDTVDSEFRRLISLLR